MWIDTQADRTNEKKLPTHEKILSRGRYSFKFAAEDKKKSFMDVKLFVLEVAPAPLEEKHTRVEEALPLECTAERNQSVFLPWEVAS